MTKAVARTWKTLFAGSIPKHAEFAANNEDCFIVSDEQQRYVVSDGASESFNSALWAKIVVESWFNRRPAKNYLSWLRTVIDQYESQSDRASMSWSQEAAFERGSYASLLACEVQPDSSVVITALGDSLAVLVRDGRICESFPYQRAEQFNSRPTLLSTIQTRNLTPMIVEGIRAFRRGEQTGQCHAIWKPQPDHNWLILLMTDALGAWLLDDSDESSSRLDLLSKVSNEQELAALVEEARTNGCMRRDDSTLIVLGDWGNADFTTA